MIHEGNISRGFESSASGVQAKGRNQERIHATPDEVVKERSRIILTDREISPADPYLFIIIHSPDLHPLFVPFFFFCILLHLLLLLFY